MKTQAEGLVLASPKNRQISRPNWARHCGDEGLDLKQTARLRADTGPPTRRALHPCHKQKPRWTPFCFFQLLWPAPSPPGRLPCRVIPQGIEMGVWDSGFRDSADLRAFEVLSIAAVLWCAQSQSPKGDAKKRLGPVAGQVLRGNAQLLVHLLGHLSKLVWGRLEGLEGCPGFRAL